MLDGTRLKVYRHAYNVRMNRGQTLKQIDNDYLSLQRLTEEEVDQVHRSLGLEPFLLNTNNKKRNARST